MFQSCSRASRTVLHSKRSHDRVILDAQLQDTCLLGGPTSGHVGCASPENLLNRSPFLAF